jgi:hypothetical protein
MFWGWQHTCPAQSVLATALPLALTSRDGLPRTDGYIEIAPTAKRLVVPFAQRFASNRYAGSPVDLHRHSAIVIINGKEMPIKQR